MLPLLRDRYHVRLSRSAVAIKTQRVSRRRIDALEDQIIAIPNDHSGAGWDSALNALDAWLGELPTRRASIEVVISNAFVRYAVVPWDRALTEHAEVEALVRIRLAALFGEDVRGWHVVIDRREFNGGIVACAIDPGLVERLCVICRSHRVKLRTVAPEFMVRYNRWRGRLSVGPLTFAQVADGLCQIALRDENGWHSMRAIRMSEPCAQTLIRVIDREMMLQGCADDGAAIYVDLPATWRSVLGSFPARIAVLAEPGGTT